MQLYFLTFILIIVTTLLVNAKHIGAPKESGVPYAREENKYELCEKIKMFAVWNRV